MSNPDDKKSTRRRFLVRLGSGTALVVCGGCLGEYGGKPDATEDAGGGDDGGIDAGEEPIAGDDSSPGDDAGPRFYIDLEKCNGCGKCVDLCPYFAIFMEGDCTLTLDGACYWQCRLPCIPICTNEAIVASSAVPERYVEVDPDKCKCCGDCVPVCPFGLFTRESDRKAYVDQSLCPDCWKCINDVYCPLDAIIYG
jgi:ferredoxin